MRNPFIVVFVSVLVMGSADAMSRELLMEPHAMFYYQVPLGGGSAAQKEGSFGFRMDQVVYSSDQSIKYAGLMQRPAILDLRLNRRGVKSFHISGMDYLKKYRIHRANGEGGEEETADTNTAGDESAADGEEELPKAPKVVRDTGNTLAFLLDNAPLGVLIGAAIGVGLIVGSASD